MSTSGGIRSTSGGSGGAATSLSRTWSSDPGTPGFAVKLSSDYAPGTTAAEPVYMESSAGGTMQRVFWHNENNVPRAAASKANEVPWKVHGHRGGDQTADLTQWWTEWNSGTLLAGIGPDGNPRLGPNRVLGSWVIKLAAADPVPAGLPAGTFIGRV